MRKRGLMLLAFTLLLAGCLAGDPTGGQPREGSWRQINQELGRSADWQKIVVDSPFQLAAPYQTGEKIEYGSYPLIDGSTVAVPMAMEFAWQHLGLSDQEATFFVQFSTTHFAYVDLIENNPHRRPDLLIATPPSQEERQLAQQAGVELVVEPVCYDAFVFITHLDNPVDSITVEQIQGIYAGEITNWKELGGEDKAIKAYQREPNSGSQTAMEQMVMQGRPMQPPDVIESRGSMGGLLSSVVEYRNNSHSIGYTYQYYLDNLYQMEDIKVLRVEGVAPEAANLRDGSYAFVATYNGVIRGSDRQAVGGRFLEWMRSEQGQRCIKQAGYVPLREVL